MNESLLCTLWQDIGQEQLFEQPHSLSERGRDVFIYLMKQKKRKKKIQQQKEIKGKKESNTTAKLYALRLFMHEIVTQQFHRRLAIFHYNRTYATCICMQTVYKSQVASGLQDAE